MRVLYLSPTGQLGGAETALLEFLAAIRRVEPSWVLQIVAASAGPLAARAASLGIPTTVMPFPDGIAHLGERGAADGRDSYWRLGVDIGRAAAAVATYIARLRELIREFDPDLVHTNGLKMHLLGAWSCGDTPLVWHLHDYLGSRALSRRLLRSAKDRCAVIVANSMSVAADAQAALPECPRVVAIHNGVDLERFTPEGDRLDLDGICGLAPAPSNTVRVGLVGTFARWKGHETFLNALARVRSEVPVRGYIIGDALYQTTGSQHSREELMRMTRKLALERRLGFAGFTERPEAALRALDVVVHASTAPEPFGLAIAEAMACGRAVIVSYAGGAAEIVTPGSDALAHQPGDVDGLAARMVELGTDATLRARLGSAARVSAERRFAPARLAAELMSVYRAVSRVAA